MNRELASLSVPFELDRHREGDGVHRCTGSHAAWGLSARLDGRGERVVCEAAIDDDLETGSTRIRVGWLQARVAEEVADVQRADQLPVVIGDDCRNAVGARAGLTDLLAS